MTGCGGEGGGERRHPLDDLVDVELDRVRVAGRPLVDRGAHLGRHRVVLEQRLRVDADRVLLMMNSSRARPMPWWGQAAEAERPLGVADVHRQLERERGEGVESGLDDVERQVPGVDQPGVALGAARRDRLPVGEPRRRVAAADDRRHPELAGDDGRVAGAPRRGS